MSFHCFIGIFVNYFYHVLLHGEGEVLVLYEHVSNIYWYYQGFHSLNATRGFVFFFFTIVIKVLDTLYLHLTHYLLMKLL